MIRSLGFRCISVFFLSLSLGFASQAQFAPVPQPVPQPQPGKQPKPIPQPQPRPQPIPQPQPAPWPTPAPQPIPQPEPIRERIRDASYQGQIQGAAFADRVLEIFGSMENQRYQISEGLRAGVARAGGQYSAELLVQLTRLNPQLRAYLQAQQFGNLEFSVPVTEFFGARWDLAKMYSTSAPAYGHEPYNADWALQNYLAQAFGSHDYQAALFLRRLNRPDLYSNTFEATQDFNRAFKMTFDSSLSRMWIGTLIRPNVVAEQKGEQWGRAAVLALGTSTGNSTGILTCTAYDSMTSSFIYGTCSNGQFTGYDSRTNAFISGTCTETTVTAYDSVTNAFVDGTCR